MDPTCIICKECFEKGNHKGHRVILQQSCNGCCDCGDKEAWKQEGFCSDHKGFETATREECLAVIPEEFKRKFFDTFHSVFNYFFQLCDAYLSEIKWTDEQGSLESNYISGIFENIIQAFHQLNENSLPMNWLYFLFLSSNPKSEAHPLLHDCFNKEGVFKLGKKEFPPVCSCSILENIFRYNMVLNKQAQKSLEDFLISLFSVYEYKQYLIVTYSKMFHFFFEHALTPGSKKLYTRVSNILSLDTQLFTSEELASLVIKTEHALFPVLDELCNLLDFPDCSDFLNVFYRIFNHLKNICLKETSCLSLLNMEGFISYFCTIVSKMEFISICVLQKSHVASETENERRSNFAMAEIWLLECSASLLKTAAERADKITVDWFGIFIRSLRRDQVEVHQRSLAKFNNQTSSYHIPIERVMSQVFLAKISLSRIVEGFDFKKLLLNYFESENELEDFLSLSAFNTLNCIGFMREIERGIWVNSGEGIKVYNIFHQKSKYSIFFLEVALLQMITPVLKKDIIGLAFSRNSVFRKLLENSWGEAVVKETLGKLEIEKGVSLFADFIDFLCFFSSDNTSLINAAKFMNRKEDEEIARLVISGVLSTFMSIHGANGAELRVIKGALQERVLSNQFKLENFLPDVANFDSKTKNFKLKENETFFSPFTFYSDKALNSELFEKLHQKYSKIQDFDFINGKGDLNNKYLPFENNLILGLQEYLKERYFTLLFDVLSNLPRFSGNLQSSMIKPLLRIISLFLKTESEKLSRSDSAARNHAIRKLIENKSLHQCLSELENLTELGFKPGPTIKTLHGYMNKIIGNEEKKEEAVIEAINELTLEQKINRENILRRQNEIKKQFSQKQMAFLKKNVAIDNNEELMGEGDSENDPVCVCCRETINLSADEAGISGFVKRSNVHQFARFQNHMQLARKEKNAQRAKLLDELSDMKNEFWGLREGGSLRFISCYHYMHVKCFSIFSEKKAAKNRSNSLISDNQSEFFCPLCNRLSNILIPVPKKSSDPTSVIDLQEELKAIFADPTHPDLGSPQELGEDSPNHKKSPIENKKRPFDLDLARDYEAEKEKSKKLPAENKKPHSQNKEQKSFLRSILSFGLPEKKLKTVPENRDADCILDLFTNILELDIVYWDFESERKSKVHEGEDRILIVMEKAFINSVNSIIDLLSFPHFLAKDHILLKYLFSAFVDFFGQYQSSSKKDFYKNKLELITFMDKLVDRGCHENNMAKDTLECTETMFEEDEQPTINESKAFMCAESDALSSNNLTKTGFSSVLLENDIDALMLKTFFVCAAYVLSCKSKIQHLLKYIVKNVKGLLIAKAMQFVLRNEPQMNLAPDRVADLVLAGLEDEECLLYLTITMRKCLAFLTIIINVSELSLFDFKIGDFESNKDELNSMLNYIGLDLEALKAEVKERTRIDAYFQALVKSAFSKGGLCYSILSLTAEMKMVNIELEYSYKNLHHIYVDKKCDFCNDFPKFGRLCLCLICGSTLCSQKCSDEMDKTGNLNRHSLEFHAGTSVFVDLHLTNVIWISSPMNFLDDPIYLDQYGQEVRAKSKESDNFHLDKVYIKRIQESIIMNTIAQEICFKKLKTSKFYYDNYF